MTGDGPDHAASLGEILRHAKAHLLYARESGVRDLPLTRRPMPERPTAPRRAAGNVPSRQSPPPAPADAGPRVSASSATAGDPASALECLRTDTIGDCRRCGLAPTRTNLVFGVGNPRAELVFVGEAPGAEEDAQGVPFVGAAGQLLTKIIEAMGLRRDDVYIANILKCRPPGNRNPLPDEIASCEPFLIAQLEIIAPTVICALGTFAAQTLLKTKDPISRLRGRWHAYHDIPLMPTFHPAYLLRNPAEKKTVWSDVQAVMARLGRPIPPTSRGRGA
ncbi:MAG: uracil-DNA glycosylase [Nitrospirota bacterium]